MRSLLVMTLATLVAAASAQVGEAASARRQPNGAIRYYDDNGGDRGYAWCRQRGGWGSMLPLDCSYYTLQQCQGAAGPFGTYCTPNPYATQAPEPRRR